MDTHAAKPADASPGHAAHQSFPGAGDPLEAVDRLETQLSRLRAACGTHAQAQQALIQRQSNLDSLQKQLSDRLQAAHTQEQAAAAREQLAADALAAAKAREHAASTRLADLDKREADLRRQDESLAKSRENLRIREEDLAKVKQRLEGLRQALRSLGPTAADSPPLARGDDLEGLIASTVRRAVDAQLQSDQMAAQLKAAQTLAAAHDQRALAAEHRAAELESARRALEESLRESQALCTQIEATTQAAITELRAEIKRLGKERDAIQARLDDQSKKIQKAGLQIEWTPEPKKPARGKRSA